MLKRSVALISFLFFFNNFLEAQLKNSWVKATIELQDKKIINGFVKEDEIGKMNFKVSFREAEADKNSIVYDTSQVKSIRLDRGEIFELIQIPAQGIDSGFQVLAKLIVSGKASLYKIYYHSDERFIIINETKMYVLENDKLENDLMEYHYFKDYLKEALSTPAISKEKIERTNFLEKDIRNLVLTYNTSFGSENKITTEKKKVVHFILAGVGGKIRKTDNEIYFQALYRTYFPKISRSTSLNVGFHYFKYKSAETIVVNPIFSFSERLFI